jgi:hypothetical protein
MVSITLTLMLYMLYKWCSGNLKCFLFHVVALTCFVSRLFGGSDAIRRAALWQCFQMRRVDCGKSVRAKRVSVAVVCMPPMMSIAARCWTLLI